jgi:hypothetical protein
MSFNFNVQTLTNDCFSLFRIENDTRNKITGMNQSVAANKSNVIGFLIDAVVKIEPKVHRNYRTSASA